MGELTWGQKASVFFTLTIDCKVGKLAAPSSKDISELIYYPDPETPFMSAVPKVKWYPSQCSPYLQYSFVEEITNAKLGSSGIPFLSSFELTENGETTTYLVINNWDSKKYAK